MRFQTVLLALAACSLGCASGISGLDGARMDREELLAGEPLGVEARSPGPTGAEDALAVTGEMRTFIDANVHRRAADQVKLQELIDAIIDTDTFGLEFDETTRTAAETYRLRRGNCLSFSHLFIAMAREVGLEASFQEVDVPPDWTLDREAFVLNRHVNVYVDLGQLGHHVVDFNIGDYRSSYDTRIISDARARAHFHNNKGVELMQAGDTATAFAAFRGALEASEGAFSPAWTNLGTLYLRAGHVVHAEAAYLEALQANPDDMVAMSNLARLYEYRGDTTRAELLQGTVARHRNHNPYYRYQVARRAFDDGDYDAAIRHLRFAIRKKSGEARFYYLLGTSYLELGDARRARKWLERAEQVAASEIMKRRSASQIERLVAAAAD